MCFACTKVMLEVQGRSKDAACRFFAAEGCKLRVGAYTSLNILCTYLESDVSAEGQAERNFWVSATGSSSAVTLPSLISTVNGHGGITPQLAGGHSPSVSLQEDLSGPSTVPSARLVLQVLTPLLQHAIFCMYDR